VSVTADEGPIRAALDVFVGTIDQLPPRHSAKKIAGERAYEIARRAEAVPLTPVAVTVFALDYLGRAGDDVRVRLTVSSGFYVRSLARDVGTALGCGGHLSALRRTTVGRFDLSSAMPLAEAEALGRDVASRLLSMADALPEAPGVRLNERGLTRALHGNPVGPEHLLDHALPPPSAGDVRLLGPGGELVAVAHSRGGALHPVLVVG
jgi:tRNA pseudouridine55 synthase